MARYDYRLVDVFTDTPFTGNALAVFPDARGLETAAMQRIAAELNLSETTFVLPTSLDGCAVRVRIFTPQVELPMAGHPTLGTAWVLGKGNRIVFEEGIGAVTVERKPLSPGVDGWWMRQPSPTFLPAHDGHPEIATALGIEPGDIDPRAPTEIGSSGVPFLYVPVKNLDSLARVSLSADRWARLASSHTAKALYVVFVGGQGQIRSRMFAPAFGISEDPATGGAGGPLIGYLLRHRLLHRVADTCVFAICEQGVEMGRRSMIHLSASGPQDQLLVEVGGNCVGVGGGWIET